MHGFSKLELIGSRTERDFAIRAQERLGVLRSVSEQRRKRQGGMKKYIKMHITNIIHHLYSQLFEKLFTKCVEMIDQQKNKLK